jgi:hypothetical protein
MHGHAGRFVQNEQLFIFMQNGDGKRLHPGGGFTLSAYLSIRVQFSSWLFSNDPVIGFRNSRSRKIFFAHTVYLQEITSLKLVIPLDGLARNLDLFATK